MDAADTPQPGEVSQYEAQISTWFAVPTCKLRTSTTASGPRLAARLLRRAPCGIDPITPALPFGGCPLGVGTGEYILDVIVDQHDVEFTALVSVVLGQFRIDFPPNPVGCLFLSQEYEVVELGGMIAIPIGREPDGDLGGNGQPLDDTTVLVMRDANDHGDSSFFMEPGGQAELVEALGRAAWGLIRAISVELGLWGWAKAGGQRSIWGGRTRKILMEMRPR
jgi:hypothetical protein